MLDGSDRKQLDSEGSLLEAIYSSFPKMRSSKKPQTKQQLIEILTKEYKSLDDEIKKDRTTFSKIETIFQAFCKTTPDSDTSIALLFVLLPLYLKYASGKQIKEFRTRFKELCKEKQFLQLALKEPMVIEQFEKLKPSEMQVEAGKDEEEIRLQYGHLRREYFSTHIPHLTVTSGEGVKEGKLSDDDLTELKENLQIDHLTLKITIKDRGFLAKFQRYIAEHPEYLNHYKEVEITYDPLFIEDYKNLLSLLTDKNIEKITLIEQEQKENKSIEDLQEEFEVAKIAFLSSDGSAKDRARGKKDNIDAQIKRQKESKKTREKIKEGFVSSIKATGITADIIFQVQGKTDQPAGTVEAIATNRRAFNKAQLSKLYSPKEKQILDAKTILEELPRKFGIILDFSALNIQEVLIELLEKYPKTTVENILFQLIDDVIFDRELQVSILYPKIQTNLQAFKEKNKAVFEVQRKAMEVLATEKWNEAARLAALRLTMTKVDKSEFHETTSQKILIEGLIATPNPEKLRDPHSREFKTIVDIIMALMSCNQDSKMIQTIMSPILKMEFMKVIDITALRQAIDKRAKEIQIATDESLTFQQLKKELEPLDSIDQQLSLKRDAIEKKQDELKKLEEKSAGTEEDSFKVGQLTSELKREIAVLQSEKDNILKQSGLSAEEFKEQLFKKKETARVAGLFIPTNLSIMIPPLFGVLDQFQLDRIQAEKAIQHPYILAPTESTEAGFQTQQQQQHQVQVQEESKRKVEQKPPPPLYTGDDAALDTWLGKEDQRITKNISKAAYDYLKKYEKYFAMGLQRENLPQGLYIINPGTLEEILDYNPKLRFQPNKSPLTQIITIHEEKKELPSPTKFQGKMKQFAGIADRYKEMSIDKYIVQVAAAADPKETLKPLVEPSEKAGELISLLCDELEIVDENTILQAIRVIYTHSSEALELLANKIKSMPKEYQDTFIQTFKKAQDWETYLNPEMTRFMDEVASLTPSQAIWWNTLIAQHEKDLDISLPDLFKGFKYFIQQYQLITGNKDLPEKCPFKDVSNMLVGLDRYLGLLYLDPKKIPTDVTIDTYNKEFTVAKTKAKEQKDSVAPILAAEGPIEEKKAPSPEPQESQIKDKTKPPISKADRDKIRAQHFSEDIFETKEEKGILDKQVKRIIDLSLNLSLPKSLTPDEKKERERIIVFNDDSLDDKEPSVESLKDKNCSAAYIIKQDKIYFVTKEGVEKIYDGTEEKEGFKSPDLKKTPEEMEKAGEKLDEREKLFKNLKKRVGKGIKTIDSRSIIMISAKGESESLITKLTGHSTVNPEDDLEVRTGAEPASLSHQLKLMESFEKVYSWGFESRPPYKAMKEMGDHELKAAITSLKEKISEKDLHKKLSEEELVNAKLYFLALIREALFRTEKSDSPRFPNITQILSVINECIINDGNSFAQIETGQGKSLTTALMAAMLWAEGQTVEVCTSDPHLAREAAEEFAEFFKFIGAECASKAITDSDNIENIEHYKHGGINYSDITSLGMFRSKMLVREGPKFFTGETSCILDEADYIMDYQTTIRYVPKSEDIQKDLAIFESHSTIQVALEDFIDQADSYQIPEDTQDKRKYFVDKAKEYISKKVSPEEFKKAEELIQDDKINAWLQAAWQARSSQEISQYPSIYFAINDFIDTPEFYDVPSYITDKRKYLIEKAREYINAHADPKDAVIAGKLINNDDQIDLWLQAAWKSKGLAETGEKEQKFVINKDKIAAGKTYSTVHHIIDQKENKDAQLMNGGQQFLHARLQKSKQAKIRTGEMPDFIIEAEQPALTSLTSKQFIDFYNGKVKGITGTLGDTYKKKRARELFHADLTAMPLHQEKQRGDTVAILSDDKALNDEILKQVMVMRKAGRPVLIICENPVEAKKMEAILQGQVGAPAPLLYTATYKTESLKDDKQAIDAANQDGAIMIADSSLGRGKDFKPKHKDGLHVIVNYLGTDQEIKQAIGRSGRQGAPGSSYHAVTAAQLGTFYNPKEITEAKPGDKPKLIQQQMESARDFIATSERRKKPFNDIYDNMQAYFQHAYLEQKGMDRSDYTTFKAKLHSKWEEALRKYQSKYSQAEAEKCFDYVLSEMGPTWVKLVNSETKSEEIATEVQRIKSDIQKMPTAASAAEFKSPKNVGLDARQKTFDFLPEGFHEKLREAAEEDAKIAAIAPESSPPTTPLSSPAMEQASSTDIKDPFPVGDPSAQPKEQKAQEVTKEDPKEKAQRTFNHILEEFCSTEKTYVDGLKKIEGYLSTLIRKLSALNSDNPNISRILDKLELYIKTYQKLLSFHENLLSNLDRFSTGEMDETACLKMLFQSFKDQPDLVSTYAEAAKQFQELGEFYSANFGVIVKNTGLDAKEQISPKDFPSLLILPVQRPPRYKLLIEDAVKQWGRLDSSESKDEMTEGLSLFVTLATGTNEVLRESENIEKLMPIMGKIKEYIDSKIKDPKHKGNSQKIKNASKAIQILQENRAIINDAMLKQLTATMSSPWGDRDIALLSEALLINADKGRSSSSKTIKDSIKIYCENKSISFSDFYPKIINMLEAIYDEVGPTFTKEAHEYLISQIQSGAEFDLDGWKKQMLEKIKPKLEEKLEAEVNPSLSERKVLDTSTGPVLAATIPIDARPITEMDELTSRIDIGGNKQYAELVFAIIKTVAPQFSLKSTQSKLASLDYEKVIDWLRENIETNSENPDDTYDAIVEHIYSSVISIDVMRTLLKYLITKNKDLLEDESFNKIIQFIAERVALIFQDKDCPIKYKNALNTAYDLLSIISGQYKEDDDIRYLLFDSELAKSLTELREIINPKVTVASSRPEEEKSKEKWEIPKLPEDPPPFKDHLNPLLVTLDRIEILGAVIKDKIQEIYKTKLSKKKKQEEIAKIFEQFQPEIDKIATDFNSFTREAIKFLKEKCKVSSGQEDSFSEYFTADGMIQFYGFLLGKSLDPEYLKSLQKAIVLINQNPTGETAFALTTLSIILSAKTQGKSTTESTEYKKTDDVLEVFANIYLAEIAETETRIYENLSDLYFGSSKDKEKEAAKVKINEDLDRIKKLTGEVINLEQDSRMKSLMQQAEVVSELKIVEDYSDQVTLLTEDSTEEELKPVTFAPEEKLEPIPEDDKEFEEDEIMLSRSGSMVESSSPAAPLARDASGQPQTDIPSSSVGPTLELRPDSDLEALPGFYADAKEDEESILEIEEDEAVLRSDIEEEKASPLTRLTRFEANRDAAFRAEKKVAAGIQALYDKYASEGKYDAQGIKTITIKPGDLTEKIKSEFPDGLKKGITLFFYEEKRQQDNPPIFYLLQQKTKSLYAAAGIGYPESLDKELTEKVKEIMEKASKFPPGKRQEEINRLIHEAMDERVKLTLPALYKESKSEEDYTVFVKKLLEKSQHTRSSAAGILTFNESEKLFSYDEGAEVPAHDRGFKKGAANLSWTCDGTYQEADKFKVTSSLVKHASLPPIDVIDSATFDFQIFMKTYENLLEVMKKQAQILLHGGAKPPLVIDFNYSLLTTGVFDLAGQDKAYLYIKRAIQALDGAEFDFPIDDKTIVPVKINASVMNIGINPEATFSSIPIPSSRVKTRERENRKAYLRLSEAVDHELIKYADDYDVIDEWLTAKKRIPESLDAKSAEKYQACQQEIHQKTTQLHDAYEAYITRGKKIREAANAEMDKLEKEQKRLPKHMQIKLPTRERFIQKAIDSDEGLKDLQKTIERYQQTIKQKNHELDRFETMREAKEKEIWKKHEGAVFSRLAHIKARETWESKDDETLLAYSILALKAYLDKMYFSGSYKSDPEKAAIFHTYQLALERLVGMSRSTGCKSANDRSYLIRVMESVIAAQPIPADLTESKALATFKKDFSKQSMTHAAMHSCIADTSGGTPKVDTSTLQGYKLLEGTNVGKMRKMGDFAPHKMLEKLKHWTKSSVKAKTEEKDSAVATKPPGLFQRFTSLFKRSKEKISYEMPSLERVEEDKTASVSSSEPIILRSEPVAPSKDEQEPTAPPVQAQQSSGSEIVLRGVPIEAVARAEEQQPKEKDAEPSPAERKKSTPEPEPLKSPSSSQPSAHRRSSSVPAEAVVSPSPKPIELMDKKHSRPGAGEIGLAAGEAHSAIESPLPSPISRTLSSSSSAIVSKLDESIVPKEISASRQEDVKGHKIWRALITEEVTDVKEYLEKIQKEQPAYMEHPQKGQSVINVIAPTESSKPLMAFMEQVTPHNTFKIVPILPSKEDKEDKLTREDLEKLAFEMIRAFVDRRPGVPIRILSGNNEYLVACYILICKANGLTYQNESAHHKNPESDKELQDRLSGIKSKYTLPKPTVKKLPASEEKEVDTLIRQAESTLASLTGDKGEAKEKVAALEKQIGQLTKLKETLKSKDADGVIKKLDGTIEKMQKTQEKLTEGSIISPTDAKHQSSSPLQRRRTR